MAAEAAAAGDCQEDVPHKLLDHSPERRQMPPSALECSRTYHECDRSLITLHAECSLQLHKHSLHDPQRPTEEHKSGSPEEASQSQEGGVDGDRLERRQYQHPGDLSWHHNKAKTCMFSSYYSSKDY